MASAAASPGTEAFAGFRARPSRWKSLWRIARRKPIGAVAAVVCVSLVFIAVFADLLAPYPADKQAFPRLVPPDWFGPHAFGTDNLFRDMFSRTLVGSRISLGIGFMAVFMGTVFGTVLGLLAGYLRGAFDNTVSRSIEVILGFPPLVFLIFFLTIVNAGGSYSLRSFLLVSLAIAIIITPTTARIVRGSALSIANLQYIEAAVSMGNHPTRVMARHVLPNVMAPIIVIASIQIGNAILAEATLSFLSLGIADAAHPSWGKMLQDTRTVWQQAWWTAVIPGAAISVAVLAFNLFGDALRDVLDPRLRNSS